MRHSESRESSPDPLTQPWNSNLAIRPLSTPRRRPQITSIRPKQQSANPSAPAQQSSLQHEQTFIFSTPTKMRSAEGAGNTSPWRIKVTLQAEEEGANNPNMRELLPNTTTTKVPLKGSHEHSPARRQSKRNRSSVGQQDDLSERADGNGLKKRRTSARHSVLASPKSLRNRAPTPKKPQASSMMASNSKRKTSPPINTQQNNDQDEGISSIGNDDEDHTTMLDRSLAESEGFSMVSIDSLRSHREQAEKEAATATQQVSKSSTKRTTSRSSRRKSSKHSPFTAFGTDTQRQLSIELALGESLAQDESHLASKRQDWNRTGRLPSPPETASLSSSRGSHEPLPSNEDSNGTATTMVTRRENLPTRPDHEDLMSWRQTTPSRANDSIGFEREDSEMHRTALAAANEIVYNFSNKSGSPKTTQVEQVDIAEDFTGTADIWQEEADRSMEDSLNSQRTRSRNLAREAESQETPDFNDLFEEDIRPSRAKIPRTWRKTSGQGFLYGDETESPGKSLPSRSQLPVKKGSNNSSSSTKLSNKPSEILVKPLPRSILSSPARREQQSYTPKEVRFQNGVGPDSSSSASVADDTKSLVNQSQASTANLENGQSLWNSFSSPLAAKSTPGGLDDGIDLAKRKIFGSARKNGYLQQLKAELIAMATPRGRELPPAPNAPDLYETPQEKVPSPLTAQDPDSESHEVTAVESDDESKYVQTRPKEDPNFDKHVQHALSIVITPSKANQSQGILSRLSSWLYPTPLVENTYTYTWNRNHYLLLNHLWCKTFQAPDFITPKEYSVGAQRRMLDKLPSSLKRLIGSRVTRYDGQTPLTVLLVHCYIAGQFITEARDKGVPILCDGRPKPGREGDSVSASKEDNKASDEENERRENTRLEDDDECQWPKRDAAGRIIRIKQDWTAEETLKALYSLWLIKSSHARTSQRAVKRKKKILSPGQVGR